MKYILLAISVMVIACNENKDDVTGQLDEIFKSYFKPSEPGAAVLLVKDGVIIYQQAIGVEDILTKKPISTKTLFNIGSITKPIVSSGILKLASERRLSLEDNLFKYFPEFSDSAIAKKINLVHLMTHTSGLPDVRKVKEQHEFYLTAKDEENWAPMLKVSSTEFEPGTKYSYSNPAFNGLALIIEKLTGSKWQDYIKTNIFQPAGMEHSTITDGAHPETGVAHAYIRDGDNQFKELDYGEEPTFAAAGNGGVWSNVEELWKLEQAIQQNKILDKTWTDESRAIYPFAGWKDSMPSRLGLSWFITKEGGRQMIGHTGSQGGFISDYCWLPEEKIFYVLLCNIPAPILEIRKKIFSIILRE